MHLNQSAHTVRRCKQTNSSLSQGNLRLTPKQGKIVANDITAQTHQVMENIKAILEAADYSLEDVVSTTVYIASMELFEEFNH